jgi:hypothetical protein
MTRKQIKEMRKLCYKGKFVTDVNGAITYCDETSGYMFAHNFNSALEGDAVDSAKIQDVAFVRLGV